MSKSRLSALPGYRAGFLPNPTLAMGAKRHSNEDCPVKAKCTDDAQKKRAYRSRCREKP